MEIKNIFKRKCPECKSVLNSEEKFKLDEYNHCTCHNCGIEIYNQYQ